MKRTTLLFLLALFASNLQAAVLVFDTTSYTTSAQVEAGVNSDSKSASSPPSALFSSASTSDGAANHATASGRHNGRGTLATTAEVSSDDLATSGFGAASFLGTFDSSAGRVNLHIHFDTNDGVLGSSLSSEGKLEVSLFGNSVELYHQRFVAGATIDQSFDLTSETFGSLEITLTSTATALNALSRNVANAQFATSFAPVPEPAPWMLVVAGILMLAVIRRRADQI